jgi:putative ABC transport system permease protein
LTGIGLAIGAAVSLGTTRALAGMLYEISSLDPVTFIAVALLLAVVALLACYMPARRAASVDPMVALRCE